MSNRIRSFEAHNIESSDGEEVWAFADGEEESIRAFCFPVAAKRPLCLEVSNINFDDFEREIMKILCLVPHRNPVEESHPVLLEIRDNNLTQILE